MKLNWTAALAAAAVAGLTKHRQVGRARPELRVPAAYTPNPLTDRSLPLMKAALARLPHAEDTGRTQVSVPSPDGPVPAFTYTPTSGEPHGALLWIHGGGRVLGSAAQDHDLCQMFADHAGVFVLSVDHRLAPEHPYPAPLDDCHAALTWLVGRRRRQRRGWARRRARAARPRRGNAGRLPAPPLPDARRPHPVSRTA